MADAPTSIVDQLDGFSQMMPEGGPSDTLIEVFAGMAGEAAAKIRQLDAALTAATERGDRLQAHLDSRPAMNAGLVEEYARWSGKMYLVDRDGVYRPERAMAFMKPAG